MAGNLFPLAKLLTLWSKVSDAKLFSKLVGDLNADCWAPGDASCWGTVVHGARILDPELLVDVFFSILQECTARHQACHIFFHKTVAPLPIASVPWTTGQKKSLQISCQFSELHSFIQRKRYLQWLHFRNKTSNEGLHHLHTSTYSTVVFVPVVPYTCGAHGQSDRVHNWILNK